MTFEELITSECDGVAIAAPAFMHAEMTLKALQNKKNVVSLRSNKIHSRLEKKNACF